MKKYFYKNKEYKMNVDTVDGGGTKIALRVAFTNDVPEETVYPTTFISVTTGNNSIIMPHCAYIDTNNWPGICKWLEENGLAKPYTRFGKPVSIMTSFHEYPLYEFNIERLIEGDKEGWEKHLKSFEDNFERVRDEFLDDLF